jgi:hypothetical protein
MGQKHQIHLVLLSCIQLILSNLPVPDLRDSPPALALSVA